MPSKQEPPFWQSSVIYTVINVYKVNKTWFISLQNLTTSKSDKRDSLNGYNEKRMVWN